MQESYEFFYALCDKTEKDRQAVIDSCENIDAQDELAGWTVLMHAAFEGEKDIVETLIKNKANLDLQTKIGDTALLRATSRGYTDIVKMLVENGANLYLSNIVDHADVRYYANRLTRTKRLEILGTRP